MDTFKKWLESSLPWLPSTPEDYSVLFMIADYVEEYQDLNELKAWFQHLRNVVVGFSKKGDMLDGRLSQALNNIWVDQPEEDALESFNNWVNKHMLRSIDRVLDDNITHNGPLFSVANAIKNSYEGLTPFLQFHDYYQAVDPDPQNIVGRINQETYSLIQNYLHFIKTIFHPFLRVAQVRWRPPADKRNSFEKLASLPKFND